MEVRANFVIVGAFFLATLLGILGAILWLSRDDTGKVFREFNISFTESVSGLSVGNQVLFSGIPVGQVSQIKISDQKIGAVSVRIVIRADTPVREDSTAQLDLRGLTGVSVVSISGGTANSPLVKLKEGEVGTILSRPSPLAAVMQDAPNILSRIESVMGNMEKFTSKENQESVSRILSSTAELTSGMAERTKTLQDSVDQLQGSLKEFNTLMKNANGTVKEYSTLAQTLNTQASAFGTETLPQIRLVLTDLRNMAMTFQKVGQNLESDPRHFLFGQQIKEYAP